MRRNLPALAFSLIACASAGAACTGGESDDDDDDGSTPTPTVTPTPVCTGAASERVHVIDDQGRLQSFDPALAGISDPFQLIGTPDCSPAAALPPFGNPAVPYALAVDNLDEAWVLYTSGEVFRLSTTDASCSATSFEPQQVAGGTTWSLFGMAFGLDVVTDPAERIWISGGAVDGSLGSLGSIDPGTFAITRHGAIGGAASTRPELMGLADGTLWGFFPDVSTGFVQQVDKTSGALLGSPSPVAPGNTLVAWGAAQWGGSFWVFATTTDTLTNNSTVRTVNRMSGADALVAQNLTTVVVAAASSTCAPVVP